MPRRKKEEQDEGHTYIAEPTDNARGYVKDTAERKTPIREMGLDEEQARMIVTEEIRKILKPDTPRELFGGDVFPAVSVPRGQSGYDNIYVVVKADARLVQMAWDYYRENIPNPKVDDFVAITHGIVGFDDQYRRIVFLNLN